MLLRFIFVFSFFEMSKILVAQTSVRKRTSPHVDGHVAETLRLVDSGSREACCMTHGCIKGPRFKRNLPSKLFHVCK